MWTLVVTSMKRSLDFYRDPEGIKLELRARRSGPDQRQL
jgi:catechol 2,3-dioxygenase-like lactoylglutathione lyase family enzyme